MKQTKITRQQTNRAMTQILNKQICAPISKDLRKKYSRRGVRIMIDDTVKVIRGEYKGITGKVTKISTANSSIVVEGNKKEKSKGEKIDVYIHSTNVIITSLNTDDKWRIKILEKKSKSKIKSMKEEAKKKDDAPNAVYLRDTLKKVKTLREAKSSIYDGKVKVDGVIQKSLHHSIGLMDVIELEGITDIYRLVPKDGQILIPIKIDAAEKSKKLVRIRSKTTNRGGKIQLGFHDGRTIITDINAGIGDTCLIQTPEQKILDVIKFEKNSQIVITSGINAGRIGVISEIKQGTFTLPKRITMHVDDKTIEIPADITMVVGKEKSVIQIR